MRTPAVQPRILSKKIIFHLHINGGTQERKFNFIKNFCMVLSMLFVLYSYTSMYNYTYTCMYYYTYTSMILLYKYVLLHIYMYVLLHIYKYDYTYKSMLFVLYNYTSEQTIEFICNIINECVSNL